MALLLSPTTLNLQTNYFENWKPKLLQKQTLVILHQGRIWTVGENIFTKPPNQKSLWCLALTLKLWYNTYLGVKASLLMACQSSALLNSNSVLALSVKFNRHTISISTYLKLLNFWIKIWLMNKPRISEHFRIRNKWIWL